MTPTSQHEPPLLFDLPAHEQEDEYADTDSSAEADEEVNIVEDAVTSTEGTPEDNVITLRRTAAWSGSMPRAPTSPSK